MQDVGQPAFEILWHANVHIFRGCSTLRARDKVWWRRTALCTYAVSRVGSQYSGREARRKNTTKEGRRVQGEGCEQNEEEESWRREELAEEELSNVKKEGGKRRCEI